jgi:hypothetical protein
MQDPLKFTYIRIFWFENIPSGNPVAERKKRILMTQLRRNVLLFLVMKIFRLEFFWPQSRVTRLGEFSRIGRLFILFNVLNITNVWQNFGLLVFTVPVTYSFWQKMGWATFWATFSNTHLVTLPQRDVGKNLGNNFQINLIHFLAAPYVHTSENHEIHESTCKAYSLNLFNIYKFNIWI